MPYWKRSVLFSGPCAVLFSPGTVLFFSTAHVVQNEPKWVKFPFEVCIPDLARGNLPGFMKKEAQRNAHMCTETTKMLSYVLCSCGRSLQESTDDDELSKSHSDSDSYVVDASEQDIQQLPLDSVLHGLAAIRP